MVGHVAPPRFLTAFVGRSAELAALKEVVDSRHLVTLIGPGGCGKTRLAARIAEEGTRWERVVWIDLTEIGLGAVPEAIATGFDALLEAGEHVIPSLSTQLAGQRLLVCLDNCEHVLPGIADLVVELLSACPDLTVLATSREPLAVPGEAVWRVPSLSDEDALALFVDRARTSGAADVQEREALTTCRRLDGMPLGIELAAAWTTTLSTHEILSSLDDRFRLLVRAPHGVAARHQSLAASMAWSYDLLDSADRDLFRRIAVFRGDFTAEAAADVVDDHPAAVLSGLRRLIEKSLLEADIGAGGSRYRMQETSRQYAASRLADQERSELEDRHLTTYCKLAVELQPLLERDKDEWRAVVTADYPNFQTALNWGMSDPAAEARTARARQLAADLVWFWYFSRRGEGMTLLGRAVELGEGERTALQGKLLAGAALVADIARESPAKSESARLALGIAQECSDAHTVALAGQLIGFGLLGTDLDAAWQAATDAESAGASVGYGFGVDGALALKGLIRHLRDEHDRARQLLQTAVDGLVPRGDRAVAAIALGYLGMGAAVTGNLDLARETTSAAVRVATPHEVTRVGGARVTLAWVEGMAGRLDEAWKALAPILQFREAPSYVPGLPECLGSLHLAGGTPELALAVYRDADPTTLSPHSRVTQAAALHRCGEQAAAIEAAAAALRQARTIGMPGVIADALEIMAETGGGGRRPEDLHHEALAIRFDHGLRPGCVRSLEALAELVGRAGAETVRARLLGACARARDDMGLAPHNYAVPRPHETEFARGKELSVADAVEYIRRSRGIRSRPDTGWDALTPTERTVATLAAEGLSNPQIGERLFIGRATVKTHISHAYAKLGVTNRTELATLITQTKA